jgi:hypothetical protein
MAQHPTPGGGPNQTLLELIFALKGLAQTIEFYHQDLSRRLDEEGRSRKADLDRLTKDLRDVIAKNGQSLSVLPITLSDRVEKIVTRTQDEIDKSVGEVRSAVSDVRSKLWEYMQVTERAISQSDAVVESSRDDRADITGRIEVTEKGDIKLQFKSSILKKIWYGIIVIATGGGAYGFVKMIKELFGG